MTTGWTADRLLETARQFQSSCIVVAAAQLDLVGPLSEEPLSAAGLATRIEADERGTAMLADALTALGILDKESGLYRPAPGIADLLDESIEGNVVAMLRHQGNCLRSWAQLADVVKQGTKFQRSPSVRGDAEDQRSFIEAMEVASREAAPRVIASLGDLPFERLLDIGGGPGTWTRAFLEAHPRMCATLYDLPGVIPIAQRHLADWGLLERVDLVEGDFYRDDALPSGADLAWVSAITHQNSRAQNRELYAKVYRALRPGGSICIRDVLMEQDRVTPVAGAMFAINMLVNTEDGGTYSLAEQRHDLESAGFVDVTARDGARAMDSIVMARRD